MPVLLAQEHLADRLPETGRPRGDLRRSIWTSSAEDALGSRLAGPPREPRLRRLHLGLDRPAEGGGGAPPRDDQPRRRLRAALPDGAGGPGAPVHLDQLRHHLRGDLPDLDPRRRRGPPAAGALPLLRRAAGADRALRHHRDGSAHRLLARVGGGAVPHARRRRPPRCAWWSSAPSRRCPSGWPSGWSWWGTGCASTTATPRPRPRSPPWSTSRKPPTCARFRAGDRVPVGRTIHNCCAYVLDAGLEPVPVGVPGDVYIGGPNVSRGYANWPDRTAASFVPDPFAAAMGYGEGLRMYRQGDVGRWLPTGDLEYLGRRDDQVKIRGFRVEPAEVGAVLARHPAVEGQHRPGARRRPAGQAPGGLPDAWSPGEAATVGELRSFLRESLPDHMVPAALLILDVAAADLERPGGPAGPPRAHRRAAGGRGGLRAAADGGRGDPGGDLVRGAGARAGRRPRRLLRAGRPLAARHPGGLPRARAAARRAAAARAVREPHPRRAGAPRRGDPARRARRARAAPHRAGAAGAGSCRCRSPSSGSGSSTVWSRGRATYNIPLALQLEGDLAVAGARRRPRRDRAAATRPCAPPSPRPAASRRRGSIRRRSRSPAGDRPGGARSGAADGGGPAPDGRGGAAARSPWSTGRCSAPPCCASAATSSVLLVTMHHIVSDGWSVPILLRELAALYTAIREGRPPAAAGAADPVRRLRALAARLAAGRGAGGASSPTGGSGSPGCRRCSSCRPTAPAPPCAAWRGAGAPDRRSAASSRGALRGAGRRHGATPFMVLLAGFAALLHRYGGQPSFAVGVADRRPQPGGDRAADRLLRQHPGAALRRRGGRRLPRPGRAHPRDGARRRRPPGRAVREAGRGAGARAQPQPLPALPGDADLPERPRARTSPPRGCG